MTKHDSACDSHVTKLGNACDSHVTISMYMYLLLMVN